MSNAEFDPVWYTQAFPDVALTGLRPEEHYERYGRLLGRARNAQEGAEEGKEPVFEPRPDATEPPVSLWAGALEIGRFQAEEGLNAAPLEAYRQMLRLDSDVFGQPLDTSVDLGPPPQAAWVKGTRLTLSALGEHLRLYQAPPEAPSALALIGGADLGGQEGLVEAQLLHPMMPVLVEYAAPDGLTTGYALLPFPTLLRGGLHHAEAAAWGQGRDPMADLWRLSRAYLDEMVSGLPSRIGSIQAENLDLALSEALGSVFDLTGDLVLDLGPDQLPTIAALVSRRIESTEAAPFLVAEAGTYRPLFSVAMPGGAPLAPVHLSLHLSIPEPAEEILAVPEPGPVEETEAEVTVAMRGADPALVARALAALALQTGVKIDRLLLKTDPNMAESDLIDLAEGVFPGRVETVQDWDLDALGEAASGDLLFLMEEDVLLHDPAAVAGLVQVLEDHPTAGAVAPTVLHEARFKKGVRVQMASAGLFPMGLSFATAPRLTVDTPDILRALPRMTYPVLANTHQACLIRCAAIKATAEARKGAWHDVAGDLKLGLDFQQSGWVSLCSTALRVGTTRMPLPRFEADPISLAYLSPADWAVLLTEVTLVRELRG